MVYSFKTYTHRSELRYMRQCHLGRPVREILTAPIRADDDQSHVYDISVEKNSAS